MHSEAFRSGNTRGIQPNNELRYFISCHRLMKYAQAILACVFRTSNAALNTKSSP